MDEKTPHMYLTFVPLIQDNRLSAKEILGNRASLSKWQDNFHAHMVEKYPDLERGESAFQTGRKHIPTRLFKQAVSISKQAKAVEAALDNIGPLNAGKKKEEALTLLKKWFPQMENFSVTYHYNAKGLLHTEAETGGVVKTYSYDANGNRTGFEMKKGSSVEMSLGYDYDRLNRLKTVMRSGAVIAQYKYTIDGNRDTLTYTSNNSSMVTSYSYNDANLVLSLTNRSGSNTLSSFTYTYDLDGNQKSKTAAVKNKAAKTTNYTYDTMGRLKSLPFMCCCYKLGKINVEECEDRLEAVLIENAVRNNHTILDDLDKVFRENLLNRDDSDESRNTITAVINVITRLQNSPFSEMRNFLSSGYMNLLILCRRYQSNEFDVLEFRDHLQTVIALPNISMNEEVENLYEEALTKLDDIEYLYSMAKAEEIGKEFADKLITAINRK